MQEIAKVQFHCNLSLYVEHSDLGHGAILGANLAGTNWQPAWCSSVVLAMCINACHADYKLGL